MQPNPSSEIKGLITNSQTFALRLESTYKRPVNAKMPDRSRAKVRYCGSTRSEFKPWGGQSLG